MGISSGRLLPVILVLALVVASAFSFGCIQPQSDDSADVDAFGAKAEALNARIAAADTATDMANLTSEVAALRVEAQNDSRFASFLTLLDAQDLTLQVLLANAEFQDESAKIGTIGIDCGGDYSSFISRMKAANATAASATSKARAYLSTNENSSAGMLISAINRTGPDMMSFYASLLEENVRTDCPAKSQAPAEYALPLSYEDALSIAISEAGDGFFVYGESEPLAAGTVITAPRALDDVNFTLKGSTWFFFLDSEPWAPFAHDARYVMIDVSGGSYLVANESMHPQIDGVPRWKSIDERSDPANILYPSGMEDIFSLPANLSPAQSAHRLYAFPLAGPDLSSLNAGRDVNAVECCPEKKKYALVMTGSNDTQFQANTKMMYEFLKGAGYGDGDIQYLSTNAAAAGSDGVTSVATLTAALNWMKANAKCCDEIFMYLAGHGSKDPVYKVRHKATNATKWIRSVAALGASPGDWERTGETGDYHKIDVNGGNPGGGDASSQVLVSYLKAIPSCKITVMYQSCHSGAAAPTLAGVPGVSVLTPVDSEHSSYGISEASGDWKAGSFFTQAYLNAKTKDNATADADRDGSVSEKEAFDHANRANHDVIEGYRTSLNNLAANETNLTKKLALQHRARELQEQRGVFREGGPCICCYVNCSADTSYICRIFNGTNMPNCPECRKVGDYCGPDTAAPGIDMPPAGNDSGGNLTGAGQGGGEEPPEDNVTAVCGDGQISGAEQCDHGNYSTNKCPEGSYCNKCQCKKLETSVVCGDGKISSPAEDCDGGSVDYKICPPGFTCSICKCLPTQAQCGDGTVTPPEECDHGNTYTSSCPGGKTCHSCKCMDPSDVPEEAYCGNNKREGAEQCDGTDDSACGPDEYCSGCACIKEPDCGDGTVDAGEDCESDNDCSGDDVCQNCQCVPPGAQCGDGDVEGGEECEDDEDCDAGEHCSSCQCVSTPTYCGDGAINGNEQCDPDASPSGCSEPDVCGSSCKCVSPPTLDCEYICSQTSGAQLISSGLGSQSQCTAATQSFFPSQTCYTTCRYSWFYRVDNIAGYASCCCGMKKQFPCSDCPGENPYCPPAESVCPANAPSWYQP